MEIQMRKFGYATVLADTTQALRDIQALWSAAGSFIPKTV